MATADDIRTGLETVLTAAFPTVSVYPRWRGNVTPPCFVFDYPRPVEEVARECWRWETSVQLHLRASDTEAGDTNMAGYLDTTGSTSVIAAIHDAKTLGGAVSSTRVVGVTDVGVVSEVDNAVVLVATWDLNIYE